MDRKILVDQDVGAGADLVNALYAAGVEVSLAFWAHNPSINEWRLFIAMPEVEEKGRLSSYRTVQGVIADAELPPTLDLPKIVLVDDADPVVEPLRSLSEDPAVDSVGAPFDQEIFNRELPGEGFLYKISTIRFEREVALALQRVAVPGAAVRANVRLDVGRRDFEYDFILDYRDSNINIIVEVKAWKSPLSAWAVEQILRKPMPRLRRRERLLIISKSGFTRAAAEKIDQHMTPVRLAQWASPSDDNALRETLESLLNEESQVDTPSDL